MASSEVKFFISSRLTVAILNTGVMGQGPLSGMQAGWWGHGANPRLRKFALPVPTLQLAHRTPTSQLMAIHSKAGGREWKNAAGKV